MKDKHCNRNTDGGVMAMARLIILVHVQRFFTEDVFELGLKEKRGKSP